MYYKIYTRVNYAETSRDADDIRIYSIGYKDKLEDALDVANKFIYENFFHKDTKLKKYGNNYQATDFCSWGKTIIVEQIQGQALEKAMLLIFTIVALVILISITSLIIWLV